MKKCMTRGDRNAQTLKVYTTINDFVGKMSNQDNYTCIYLALLNLAILHAHALLQNGEPIDFVLNKLTMKETFKKAVKAIENLQPMTSEEKESAEKFIKERMK